MAMKEIGIIGFGNMGSSIAEQIKGHYEVHVFDKEGAKYINNDKEILIRKNLYDLLYHVRTLLLAIKPQDFQVLLEDLRKHIRLVKTDLIISIMAGISTATIERSLGEVPVVRVMPNIALKIGAGISCISKGRFADDEELKYTQELFEFLGETLIIDERLMDAATAISGSGPGFFYDLLDAQGIKLDDVAAVNSFSETVFLPSLEKAALDMGFSEENVKLLVEQTTVGSIALLRKSKFSPAQLRDQVASKGGTTEAGLKILHQGGSLEDAAKAALKRAKELSKE